MLNKWVLFFGASLMIVLGSMFQEKYEVYIGLCLMWMGASVK
jgi:hypothetical protein